MGADLLCRVIQVFGVFNPIPVDFILQPLIIRIIAAYRSLYIFDFDNKYTALPDNNGINFAGAAGIVESKILNKCVIFGQVVL